LEVVVMVLSKEENLIWKKVLKEEWEVETLRLGDLWDVLCRGNGDPVPGNLQLDGLECRRFLLE
jgi:hypothetical protein